MYELRSALQNSVFECVLDAAQLVVIQQKLVDIIDESCDSLRLYQLGNKYKSKVMHFGAKPSVDVEGTIII